MVPRDHGNGNADHARHSAPDHTEGWPIDTESTPDPEDAFAHALRQAAARKAAGAPSTNTDDGWLTADTPSVPMTRARPASTGDWDPAVRRHQPDDRTTPDAPSRLTPPSRPDAEPPSSDPISAAAGWLREAVGPASALPRPARRRRADAPPPTHGESGEPAGDWTSGRRESADRATRDTPAATGGRPDEALPRPAGRRRPDAPYPLHEDLSLDGDLSGDQPVDGRQSRPLPRPARRQRAAGSSPQQAIGRTRHNPDTPGQNIPDPDASDPDTPVQNTPGPDPDAPPTPRKGAQKRWPDEPPADPMAKAKDICLTLLTVRARSRSELTQALRRKGIDDDVAEQVLGRLDVVGLIDDAAFAESWVHSRHNYQGLGSRALKAELHRKGVSAEIAAEAVAAVDRDAEELRARELVRKRLGTMRGLDETVKIRRLLGMLARKGYSQGLAYAVIKDELRDEGSDVDFTGADE